MPCTLEMVANLGGGGVVVTASLIEAFQNPSIYPEPTQHIEVHETHASIVFVTDHYVYKIKKSVDLGFLDYSTLERRRHHCQMEVDLNRRLSPDVYLQIVAIRQTDTGYDLNGDGTIVEYAVKMRRLPDAYNLEYLLRHRAVTGHMLERLAELLADFHAAYAPLTEQQGYGTKDHVDADWQENFAQTSHYVPDLIEQDVYVSLQQLVTSFLHRHADWFEQRVADGHVRDCHGDLRADHVYFLAPTRIRILDCIEFNQRFRYIDVASEVAFLAMDIDRLGFPSLANHFVQSYVRYANDQTLYRLLDFYRCYRAFVRGKVAALRMGDNQSDNLEAARQAKNYFRLAAQEARRFSRPLLMITTGLIGSGKSSVAAEIGAALGTDVLQSDKIRKETSGLASAVAKHTSYGKGLYSNANRQHVYTILAEQAAALLQDGQSVILDASFSQRANRQHMAQLAEKVNADFLILECVAPPSAIQKRLQDRANNPSSISDAGLDLLPSFTRQYESISPPEQAACLQIDTSQPLRSSCRTALGNIYVWRRKQ